MEYSSENEEEFEGILKQAFEVKITSDFNPNSIPKDGHEFLQHVIYERKNCKEFLTSNINTAKFTKNQTISIKLDKPLQNSSQVVPSKEWQYNKLTDFQDFRHYLYSNIGEQSVTSFDEAYFLNSITTELPVYSKLSKLAQCAKIKMLELLTRHLASLKPGISIGDNVGMWIFSILALLDIPLSPNDCYVMREFAKKCLYIRSNLSDHSDRNNALALNFFICIVGRFYNQIDLADE